MRMRVRAGRYSTGNSAGGKIFGIFLIMFGLMFALSSISMSCRTSMIKKMIPGDAKEYDAYITEVLSVKSDVVWKEDSDGDSYKTTVYDSRVVLEYEIEGQTYTTSYTFKERSKACQIGDKYRLTIDPKNPTKIYGYSTGEGGVVLMAVEIVFGLIGGAIVLAGIILIVKNRKRAKAEKEQAAQMNQGYPGNQGVPEYQGTSGYQGVPDYQETSSYQGVPDYQGASGYQGMPDYQGTSGYQGVSDYQETAGYQGVSDYQGTSGYQGVSDYQEKAGYQGMPDYSGYSEQNYVGNEYNGQGYDASTSHGTNYSGTSLRD